MPGIYRETGQHGNYDQSQANWKGSIAVSPADLIFRDAADGYDKPASSFTWDTDIATTQAGFHDSFRGVSMARRLASQTADGGIGDGNILESGEFCFPCAALGVAAAIGEYVAPAKASGNALENQKVAITASLSNAIGVLSRPGAVGDTFLYFKIKPALSAERGVQAVQ